MHITTNPTIQHTSGQTDFEDVIRLFDDPTKIEGCTGPVRIQSETNKVVDPDANRRCTLCGVLRVTPASLLRHKANVHGIDPFGRKIKEEDFMAPDTVAGQARFRVF